MKEKKRHHAIIILLLLAGIVLISISLPRPSAVPEYLTLFSEGEPWTHPTLIASVETPIEYDDDEKQAIVDSVKRTFVPIFKLDNLLERSVMAQLSKAMADSGVDFATRALVIERVERCYADGVVDDETFNDISSGELPELRMVESEKVLKRLATANMRSARAVGELLDTTIVATVNLRNVRVVDFIKPNVVLDTEKNDAELEKDCFNAVSINASIKKGEAIITNGTIVTPYHKVKINSYVRKLDEIDKQKKDYNNIIIGEILVVVMLMVVFYVFMYKVRPRTYAKLRRMVFLITFMTIFVVAVFLVVRFRANMLYVIPFALVPIIVTTFYDSRTSFFVHMLVVLICSFAVQSQAEVLQQASFIIMQFIAGGIAILSVQELTKRSQLVTCAGLIFIAYCLSFTAFTLVNGQSIVLKFHSDFWHVIIYFTINCVVLSFAYFGIFIVEKFFGFTSTVTLVELCDIYTPEIRKLADECPGTFQHSLQVANIAGEAALKIKANVQLVRAGALYHDIGKISNPAFFIENQHGVNPHDHLDAERSAQIVIQHVADGLKRAREAKLPQVILDLIAQHHGRGVTRYFYNKTCQAHPGEKIDREPYTYPGPNPQTKEAAILMMADACEAATRSLKDHSEQTISDMVNRIVDAQVADGLFRESNISFRDVETAKRVFIERLTAFYHIRVSYPDDVRPDE